MQSKSKKKRNEKGGKFVLVDFVCCSITEDGGYKVQVFDLQGRGRLQLLLNIERKGGDELFANLRSMRSKSRDVVLTA